MSAPTPVEELREAARLMREDEDTRWRSVADWLEDVADFASILGLDVATHFHPHAFTVARAYLGTAR